MFQKARIRLTAWYLLIIMAVSLMFSSIIYRAAIHEFARFEELHRTKIERRMKVQPLPLPSTPELIEEAKERILWLLFILNSGIFVVSGLLGYLLAGRTLNPIQEMLDEQHRFISDASHELKTPLTSLKTAMEVHLREKKLTEKETRSLLEESIVEVDKLQSLTDSLLQLALHQQSSIQFENVSVKAIITRAVQKIKPIAKEKDISVIVSTSDGEICGNEQSLVNLLVILLDNALKYSPSKSTVSIVSKKTGKSITVTVSDEGEGIDKKNLPHVFDRFYRSDVARSRKDTGGYGLGLSIAKKIVNAHQATIIVQSIPQKGSTFIVTFPLSF